MRSYKPKRDYQKVSQEDNEEIELTIYDKMSTGRYKKDERLEFRKRKPSVMLPAKITSRFSPMCFVVGVIIVLVTLIVAVAIMLAVAVFSESRPQPAPQAPPTENPTYQTTPLDASSYHTDSTPTSKDPSHFKWTAKFQPAYNEMSILIHDTNDDGTPDILSTFLTEHFDDLNYVSCPDKTNKCMEDYGYEPCTIRIVAIDGLTGQAIWTLWVGFSAFAINCQVDLNQDDVRDCLFAGRGGAFAAVDVHAGSILWVVDERPTFPRYNYFYPAISRDFDHDDTSDIIITHGGDQFYADSEKNRSPGFIFVVSGKTGEQISPMFPMPDDHETYSSPVLYTTQDIDLVLYGSGGETISGSLWAITLDSLQESVMRFLEAQTSPYTVNKKYVPSQCYSPMDIDDRRPHHTVGDFKKEKHESWMDVCPKLTSNVRPLWNKYKLCAYEFVGRGKNGHMSPPVKADLTNDGVQDLIVSQFNDHTLLIDGESGERVWNHFVPGTQTYSIPAPLHYNDDDILDVLMRFNKGRWMTYDYSYLQVLDGRDGKTHLMPTLNCTGGVMSSPVIAQSKVKGQDGMFFIGVGCKDEDSQRAQRSTQSMTDSCPRWYVEGQACSAMGGAKRDKRHDGMDDDVGSGNGDPVSPNVAYPTSPKLDSNFLDNVWMPQNKSDVFPDPWVDDDTRHAFIEDYCGLDIHSMTVHVYFLTPSLIESGGIRPLMTFEPFVYRATDKPKLKRHNPGGSESNDLVEEMLKDVHMVRCSHILAPYMLSSSPGMHDLNGDGLLDGVVSLLFFSIPNDLGMVMSLHPSTIYMHAFTFEEKVREVYGEYANSVNFGEYHPIEHQSWMQYMGSKGDNTFEHHFAR